MSLKNRYIQVRNPYHVVVRRRGGDPTLPRMSLQLYQVDQRSYLLDFKSLVDEEGLLVLLDYGSAVILIYTCDLQKPTRCRAADTRRFR